MLGQRLLALAANGRCRPKAGSDRVAEQTLRFENIVLGSRRSIYLMPSQRRASVPWPVASDRCSPFESAGR